jgi:serine/threonine protein kinase/Flp pilus assembly protein TadD
MADSDWSQIKVILDEAIRRGPDERSVFLDEACGGNDSIRREVQSLLSSFASAENFMEDPPFKGLTENSNTLMEGQVLGHYEILRRIGEGGMGTVYLGRDTKLERLVAVKVLNVRYERHDDNIRRFVQEAKAASALNHPNILTIFEIGDFEGSHYIVSEYIEGKTLREIIKSEMLELPTIVDIAGQIANALAAAHKARIVHRDIKPENIIIRDDGYVKVLDFGLAKLIPENVSGISTGELTAKQNATASGMILGTVNYMSPEQAKGKKVDHRTDIFSLGVVLYELLTGKQPFAGDSMPETFRNLIDREPEPINSYVSGIPDELQRITSRMLEKAPEDRYRSMSEVAGDLKALSSSTSRQDLLERTQAENPTAVIPQTTDVGTNTTAEKTGAHAPWYRRWPMVAALVVLLLGTIGLGGYFWRQKAGSSNDIKSLAVLPLENLSGDPAQDYFADGMTEAVIANLSQIGSIKVISRTSVMRYKNSDKTIPEIARELGVDGIVEGSVQRAGDRVRLTAQLVDVASDSSIWSRSFERQMSDILNLQSEIAQTLAREIRVQLTPAEQQQFAKSRTFAPEALEANLLGMYHFNKFTVQDERKAFEQFRKAVSIEPKYAEAWANLADTWTVRAMFADVPIAQAEQPTRDAANKALEVDPDNAAAHTSLCFIQTNYGFDWIAGENSCRRAIELDPNNVRTRFAYAYLLQRTERFDEMADQMEISMKLDPADPQIPSMYGAFLTQAHKFALAEKQLARALDLDPDWPAANRSMLDLHIELGRFDDANKLYQKLVGKPDFLYAAYIYARKGDRQKAKDMLDRRQEDDPRMLAKIYAALDDFDKAFEVLNRSLDRGEGFMFGSHIYTELDKLKSDPRWRALMRRMNRD